MNLGPMEIVIILLVILLLFGATRLPKLARSMGEATKEFKKGIAEKDAENAAKPATDNAPSEGMVTMSKADLEALLAEREAKARREASPPPAQ